MNSPRRTEHPSAIIIGCLILSCFLLMAIPALGQGSLAVSEDALMRLADATDGGAQVSISPATGLARFVRLPAEASQAVADGGTVEEKAADFLNEYGAAFGVRNAAEQLVLVEASAQGMFESRGYAQIHGGVPVFAGLLRVHFDLDGNLVAVNGTLLPDLTLDTTPNWSAEAAGEVAINAVESEVQSAAGGKGGNANGLTVADSQLYVYRDGLIQGIPGLDHLAWELEVVNDERSIRELVYVDAHFGKVLNRISGIHTVLDREVSETNLTNVIWDESMSHPVVLPGGWAGGSAQQIIDWQNEIDGAGESYNFFATLSGGTYLGYDGAMALMRTVNNDPQISCPNANWNGTSANYCTNVTADDVVSHEWGHAYTEFTSGLIYQWQPGALNESYSDIWGEVVDLINGRGTDTPNNPRTDGVCSQYSSPSGTDNSYRWLIGEDATAFGNPLRDMWRPSCRNHPNSVTHTNYFCSAADAGGVHYNSGVPNRTFALIADGSTQLGITGLGLTKAARIHWEAQNLLTPASDFADHADALDAACLALQGATLFQLDTANPTPTASFQVITAADCAQVSAAITATELRTPPPCNFQPPLLAKNPPALCGGDGKKTIDLQDWESGLGTWTVGRHSVANVLTFDTADWAVVSGLPDSQPGSAAFVEDTYSLGDCVTDIEAGVLYLESPTITIPPGASPRLVFEHWVATERTWDGGNLKVSVNGSPYNLVGSGSYTYNTYNTNLAGGANDNPLAGEPAFTGSDPGSVAGSWGESQVNLAGIAGAGDNVKFRFEMGLDGCNGLIGWYVDTVETYSCCVQPPGGLHGWWPLDESTGPYAFDLADSNTGLHMGGPTPTTGQVAGALDFDGIDDYLQVKDCSNLDFAKGDFSIDAWIKTTDNQGMIVAKRTQVGSTYTGYLFMVYNNRLLLQIADPSSSWSNFVSVPLPTLNNGDWNFVAVTVDRDDPNGGTFYFNGFPVSTFNPTNRQGNLNNTSELRIGRSVGGGSDHYFDGTLDEIEIFKRELAPKDIEKLWNAGSAGKCKFADIPKLAPCTEGPGGN